MRRGSISARFNFQELWRWHTGAGIYLKLQRHEWFTKWRRRLIKYMWPRDKRNDLNPGQQFQLRDRFMTFIVTLVDVWNLECLSKSMNNIVWWLACRFFVWYCNDRMWFDIEESGVTWCDFVTVKWVISSVLRDRCYTTLTTLKSLAWHDVWRVPYRLL